MKTKLPLSDARVIAHGLLNKLRPYCQRIEIAGSIRRGKAEIGDIELVAVPKSYDVDMFGMPLESHSLDSVDWSQFGEYVMGGHKMKKAFIYMSHLHSTFLLKRVSCLPLTLYVQCSKL